MAAVRSWQHEHRGPAIELLFPPATSTAWRKRLDIAAPGVSICPVSRRSLVAQGPLKGVRVVEFAGIGPGPFAGMLLSDLGADVVRVDRKDARPAAAHQVTQRGRRSLALDLKNKDSIALCLDLFERAEIVFEGFRPGVME